MECPKCGENFDPKLPLSHRAKMVLPYVLEGLSNAEIAEKMDVETRTVKSYITKAMAWYGVRNRVQLGVLIYKQMCKSSGGENASVPPEN
jgi:DNA-binding NarL/FixJ family response regulator